MSLQVIFENQYFVAVEKPGGYLTIPGRSAVATSPVLNSALSEQLGVRLWTVHRLDFEVSGIVLFAKSPEAHQKANQWFEHHDIQKSYEALTTAIGTPPRAKTAQCWECKLLRGKKRVYESESGKPCTTLATFLGEVSVRGQMAYRWSLEPRTGRSHQLRYELFRHGFPILGDTLYGSNEKYAYSTYGTPLIALRAVALDFSDCPGYKDFGLPEKLWVTGLPFDAEGKVYV